MTRLDESDIRGIAPELSAYDREQSALVGGDYLCLARLAAGCGPAVSGGAPKVAVVPVTAGEGLIGGFSEAVCDILTVCGAQPYITEGSDVTGLQQAFVEGVDLVFTADDDSCIAFAPGVTVAGKPITSDNSLATGRGFAVALEQMIARSGTGDRRVLVLGAGPVGTAAALRLKESGFELAVFDLDEQRGRALAKLCDARLEGAENCYINYQYIVDATTSGGFITEQDVSEDTHISAPGVPLCVTAAARVRAQVYHNPLELGVATMYFDCLRQLGRAGAGEAETGDGR